MPKVLNVGGNSKDIDIPDIFYGWEHHILDIDPSVNPDILADARKLWESDIQAEYDAVYCSHNLEHYYEHEVDLVLYGFYRVLKENGFIYVVVPNLSYIFQKVVENDLDIDDELYHNGVMSVRVKDVIFGLSEHIRVTGNDYFAHKTGFTIKSLSNVLAKNGFTGECHASECDLYAVAKKG